MAIYSNLEVFKATYDLLLLLYQTTANVKREYRFTLAENIKKEITELCIIIYRANKAEDKIPPIDDARELLVRIKLQCRMLVDLHQISIKLFALITQHTDSIQKQLDAWHKYQTGRAELNPLLADIFTAYFDARRHKRNSNSQLIFEQNFEDNLMEIYQSIVDRSYKVKPSNCFMVTKPVKREVFAADFRDRVVHHLIFNYIAPMFERGFIDDSYSCRTGRGTLYGTRRLDYHIKSCSKNGTVDAWILKLDIQGYFMNIDRALLFEKVWNTIIKNRRRTAPDGRKWGEKLDYSLLEFLLREIIFNDPTDKCIVKGSTKDWIGLPPDKSLFHTPKGCGLPIGNLTSQLFSNIYLSDFDNYCKRELKLKHYGRYVDDFYVIHNSQQYLRELVGVFETYLRENLALRLHPRKRYLQHYTHGVSFLGSKMNGHSILMGERIRKGAMQTVSLANRQIDEMTQGEPMPDAVREFVHKMNSYLGLMVHGNSYDLRQRLLQRISPAVLQWTAPDLKGAKMVLLYKPQGSAATSTFPF